MILSIRTDKPEAEIGLFDGKRRLAYEKWQAHRKLSETVHTKIRALLENQDKTLQDIKGIVVYQGPGSFTGLRIGISVANALAYSLDVKVAAATGQDWTYQGIEQLLKGQGKQLVTPEYGSPVHITQPKK